MHWLIGGKRRREERREEKNTEVAPGFLLRSAVARVLKELSEEGKGEKKVEGN